MNARTAALSISTAIVGVLAALVGVGLAGRFLSASRRENDGDASAAPRLKLTPSGDEGHAAPDLAAGATPDQRPPAAFRPDMDAPMTDAEREALRPAAGPSPTLVDTGTSMPG